MACACRLWAVESYSSFDAGLREGAPAVKSQAVHCCSGCHQGSAGAEPRPPCKCGLLSHVTIAIFYVKYSCFAALQWSFYLRVLSCGSSQGLNMAGWGQEGGEQWFVCPDSCMGFGGFCAEFTKAICCWLGFHPYRTSNQNLSHLIRHHPCESSAGILLERLVLHKGL